MLYFNPMTKPLRVSVEVISKCLQKKINILEVGSRQAVNQADIANLRPLFLNGSFTGVDMQAGDGVDVVVSAEKLPFKNGAFDVVFCLETLEHAQKPWLVAKEIERVLKPGGVAVVSSQQNFPIHMHPSDYFRYTPFGLKELFGGLSEKLVISISPPFDDEVKLNPQQVILVAIKGKNPSLISKIKRLLKLNVDKISGHKPYRHRIQDAWRIFKRALNEFYFRQEIEFF